MISKILVDANNIPKTIGYKITKGLLTIADEEEACKDSKWAYYFAKTVPGADIEKCQESACKDPYYAYCFAKEVPEADIGKCRKICKGTKYAF